MLLLSLNSFLGASVLFYMGVCAKKSTPRVRQLQAQWDKSTRSQSRDTKVEEAERFLSTSTNFRFGLKSKEAQTCCTQAAICGSGVAFGRITTWAGRVPRQRKIPELRVFLLWLKGCATLKTFGFLCCLSALQNITSKIQTVHFLLETSFVS